jgi:hypothetical protein
MIKGIRELDGGRRIEFPVLNLKSFKTYIYIIHLVAIKFTGKRNYDMLKR